MKISYPGPSVMEVSTKTSSLQVEYGQLAKKLESSKATTRHIKQVSGEPQATQINLLRHQRTDCHNIDIKRRDLIQNPSQVAINHMDMTNTKVKYHRGT